MAELSAAVQRTAAAALAGLVRSAGRGVGSICSAHPLVLRAVFERALERDAPVLVESTSNQVNQHGGYTGWTPAQFVVQVRGLAAQAGLAPGRLVLGGDHLGPHPWRASGSDAAMHEAAEMVRQYVLAGYAKIHLDASMPCADDPPGGPAAEVAAARAAELAAAAEEAWASRWPQPAATLYVIGTEVPPPGGQTVRAHAAPPVTRVADAERTLELTRRAFERRGIANAWDRVIALVVQCGVEFGDDVVFPYARPAASELAAFARADRLVFEAHSTDYQEERALRALVEDGFGVLKVGPALTFAFREAVFALEEIERVVLGRSAATRLSGLREALDAAMCRDPGYWRPYVAGADDEELRARRLYGLSDRPRYYWPLPAVQEAVLRLFANLEGRRLSRGLVAQYLPDAVDAFAGKAMPDLGPRIARAHVGLVLRRYEHACGAEPALAAGPGCP